MFKNSINGRVLPIETHYAHSRYLYANVMIANKHKIAHDVC